MIFIVMSEGLVYSVEDEHGNNYFYHVLSFDEIDNECPICKADVVFLENAGGYACPRCDWSDGMETKDVIKLFIKYQRMQDTRAWQEAVYAQEGAILTEDEYHRDQDEEDHRQTMNDLRQWAQGG